MTTRSGISSFVFPAGTQSNVLFKVAGSINPVTASSVQIVGHDEVAGQVSSGQFCGTGTNYTLHFVARFDRPFSSAGTWDSGASPPGDACSGTTCGVLCDLRHDQGAAGPHEGRHLLRQHTGRPGEPEGGGSRLVGATGWAPQAQRSWKPLLGRVAVQGGTSGSSTSSTPRCTTRSFPQCVSDVPAATRAATAQVHTAGGREVVRQLLRVGHLSQRDTARALVAPTVGDMVQSLVDDAQQTGWLPKWAIVGGDESQMNGDSADRSSPTR